MFDSHVHLDTYPAPSGDVGAATRARAAGITGALNPAVDLASSRRALAIHQTHPWVRPCLGLHPLHLGTLREPPLDDLRALAVEGSFAAVGEVGLDFWSGRGDELRQRTFFSSQAQLAAELGLPLVVHLRKAFYEGFGVLREIGFEGPVVCHGFSGSGDMARLALDRNGYLGAGAALLRPGANRLREVFAGAPRDRVLVETDGPHPEGREFPGRDPWELSLVVERLAEVWKIPPPEAAAITRKNAEDLFPAG